MIDQLVSKLFRGKAKANPNKPKYEMLPESVTVYVSLLDYSLFSHKSFDNAAKFFREEAGIDVRFEYKKRDEIDQSSLDHVTKLTIVEYGVQEFIEKRKEAYEKKSFIKVGRGITTKEEESKYLHDLIESDQLGVKGRNSNCISGLSNPSKSSVYLCHHFNNFSGSSPTRKAKRMIKILDWESEKKDYKQAQTLTIVHEMCHMAGLTHLTQFEDIRKFYRENDGRKNIMEPYWSSEDKVGISADQISVLRSYFSRGEAYKRFEQAEFELEVLIGQEANEKKTGEKKAD